MFSHPLKPGTSSGDVQEYLLQIQRNPIMTSKRFSSTKSAAMPKITHPTGQTTHTNLTTLRILENLTKPSSSSTALPDTPPSGITGCWRYPAIIESSGEMLGATADQVRHLHHTTTAWIQFWARYATRSASSDCKKCITLEDRLVVSLQKRSLQIMQTGFYPSPRVPR